jgi:integrase
VGYIGNREDGRRFIQWVDGSGKQRQETLPETGKDGRPLTDKGIEKEGRRRLAEYEGKALRQRRGLDPLPSESLSMTFGELFTWWWEQKGKTLRSAMVKPFLEKHLRTTLCPLPLREITSTRLQRLLADKTGDLAPKSLNHLRGYVFNIFEVARKPGGPWEGRANPVEDVERYKVVPTPKKILQPDEFEPVLAEVPEVWKGPVATALYAVMREGEIFGLLKEHVDLKAGVIMVRRSWDAPRTKDGKALPVPIADQLRPYLEAALRDAPGELVFPKPDGSMQSRKLRLNRMLRAAIARAGLIEGFEHRCRAPHCGWKERRPDSKVAAVCPKCAKPSLWAKPIPRHVRFHDTRHSGGTAMVKKAGMAVAQKFLRHSDVRLTIHTYGHLEAEDVREGLGKAFPSTCPKVGTAPGLQNGEAADGKPADGLSGTAETEPQAPDRSGDSGSALLRTDAAPAPSAAWARTRSILAA